MSKRKILTSGAAFGKRQDLFEFTKMAVWVSRGVFEVIHLDVIYWLEGQGYQAAVMSKIHDPPTTTPKSTVLGYLDVQVHKLTDQHKRTERWSALVPVVKSRQ